MSTTKSIGTSISPLRDYATITLWHAAFATGGWIGECYNDSEFNETPSIGGSSAPNYEILSPATGQSALDNSANPLQYDVTKGVGLKTTVAYSIALTVGSYCTVQRMQVLQAGAGNNNVAISTPSGPVSAVIDRCIAQNSGAGTNGSLGVNLRGSGGAVSLTNSLVITYFGNGVQAAYGSVVCANVTVVCPSDKTNTNFAFVTFQSTKITNCAGFGFSGGFVNNVGGTPTGSNNATDAASIGFTSASSLTSQTYANQFTGTASTAMDYRLKAGNALDGAGATDTTDIPAAIDIFGTAR